MTLYPNALMNAQDGAKYPPLPQGHRAKEIEFFIGDSPEDSVCHFLGDRWIDINLKNAGSEPVYQVLIDSSWAYIEADSQVLLDRLNGFSFPPMPQQEVSNSMAKVSGVEI